MKVYFFDANHKTVGEFLEEPAHLASLELPEGASTLAARYSLVDGQIVDSYEDKTDEEVIAEIKAANDAEAERLAALNAQP